MSFQARNRCATLLCVVLLLTVWVMPVAAKSKDKGPKRTPTAELPAILLKIIMVAYADPDTGPAPLKVQFTTTIHDTENMKNLRLDWDFGDGSPKVTAMEPVHVYKKPGDYKAVVRAHDSAGRSGVDDLNIEVEAPE